MIARSRFFILVLIGLPLISCVGNEQPEAARQTDAAPQGTHKPAQHQTPGQLANRIEHQRGDLALRGGTPTIRRPYVPQSDNPATSNNESNDQPLGNFGTETVTAFSHSSGYYYTLDADLDEKTLSRIYFPKGGWVDFPDCELEDDYTGSCEDEEGRTWDIEAEAPEDESSDDESEDGDE